jgi:hypothetical protein
MKVGALALRASQLRRKTLSSRMWSSAMSRRAATAAGSAAGRMLEWEGGFR